MADRKVTELNSVDYNNDNTKVVGVKGNKAYLVQLKSAAQHNADEFAPANHGHDDYVKSVTINGSTYEPNDGDVAISIQEGGASVEVDSVLSSASENPVQNKVVKNALDNKVDKVSGKGLSTNDYTTSEKNKLNGIESGAQVNVIESITINGVDATISGKNASVSVPVGDTPDLTNYVQKSETSGLLKNDGTIDTNTYLTQHQDISGKADKSELPTKLSELENDSRFIKSIESVNIPDGYRQVFYIESNGTQGITTNIIPDQNTGFELDFQSKTAPTASNAPQIINAGGRGTQDRLAISLYKTGALSGEVMIKTTSINARIDINARQVLRYINDGTNKTLTYTDNSTISVESSGEWVAKESTSASAKSAPLIIFGLKSGDSYDRCFIGRLYRLKVYNLTELAYDFVPAIRESDNKVGLYDVVNGVFYTDTRENATPFTYGDDEILNRVSQLIMDKNFVTDNNFTNAYKNKVDNANSILTSVPSGDGTYVLKAVVSNGSVTYSWVAE